VLVGLGIDPDLGDHGAGGGDEGAEQVDAGGLAVGRPPGGLAAQANGLPAGESDPASEPAGQGVFQRLNVEGGEQVGQAGLGRGLAAGEAQGVGQSGAVVAAELGDGGEALGAGEDGDDGEGQDGSQRVDPAAGVARVGDAGQSLDQGQIAHGKALLGGYRRIPRMAIPIFSPSAKLKQRTALGGARLGLTRPIPFVQYQMGLPGTAGPLGQRTERRDVVT
jgi:hypothetical protein